MARTKRKKKTKNKRRTSTTWTAEDRLLMRRILQTVKEDVADLAAVLNCVPLLRKMGDVMHDIQHSPPSPSASDRSSRYGSNDAIGRAALRYFGVSLNERLSRPGQQLVEDTCDLAWDISRAIDDITEAVRWRLYRLEALIRLLKEVRPKARRI